MYSQLDYGISNFRTMFTSVNNVFQQLYIANSNYMCLEYYMEDHHVMFKYIRCKPTMIYILRSLLSWNYIFVRGIIPTVVQSTFGKPFTQWLWARIECMFVCIGKTMKTLFEISYWRECVNFLHSDVLVTNYVLFFFLSYLLFKSCFYCYRK